MLNVSIETCTQTDAQTIRMVSEMSLLRYIGGTLKTMPLLGIAFLVILPITIIMLVPTFVLATIQEIMDPIVNKV